MHRLHRVSIGVESAFEPTEDDESFSEVIERPSNPHARTMDGGSKRGRAWEELETPAQRVRRTTPAELFPASAADSGGLGLASYVNVGPACASPSSPREGVWSRRSGAANGRAASRRVSQRTPSPAPLPPSPSTRSAGMAWLKSSPAAGSVVSSSSGGSGPTEFGRRGSAMELDDWMEEDDVVGELHDDVDRLTKHSHHLSPSSAAAAADTMEVSSSIHVRGRAFHTKSSVKPPSSSASREFSQAPYHHPVRAFPPGPSHPQGRPKFPPSSSASSFAATTSSSATLTCAGRVSFSPGFPRSRKQIAAGKRGPAARPPPVPSYVAPRDQQRPTSSSTAERSHLLESSYDSDRDAAESPPYTGHLSQALHRVHIDRDHF